MQYACDPWLMSSGWVGVCVLEVLLHDCGHLYGFAEKGFCMLGDLCPYDHGMDPVVVEDIGIPNVLSFPPPPAGNIHLVLA